MFSEIPFLKLFIALSIGIISSVFFGVNVNLCFILIGFISIIIAHKFAHWKIKWIPLFGFTYYLFIFLIGSYWGTQQKQKSNFKLSKSTEYVIGKVSNTPKAYDKFIKTNLNIESILIANRFEESSGKCLLMIEKDSLSSQLKKGDYIQFEPQFKEIKSQTNPETFNYKRYLFFHLITQQAYLKSNKWHKIKIKQAWFNTGEIANLRRYLLEQYKNYGITDHALSVLSALTLGYKNELDYSIQKAYAASGAIHVLAVSGLHIGIVFVIINFVLKALGRSKISKLIRLFLSLSFIWFFALLTGGSPSVLRASLMFSFIALGLFLKRQNQIYNSIFASAFLLLLYNPFLLFDLSFQLSYSAVISIVFFQPKISQLISFKHSIPKWIWSLSSVSLAAQIGTFPITIFYFHQFPNYFLFSNFIVIPLASLVIWLSLLFFLSLKITFIAHFIAFLLQQIILFQNYLIQQIEHLPYALTENLYFNKIQLGLLLSIILMLMLLSYKRTFKYWIGMGSLILIFLGYNNFLLYRQEQQRKLIIYDIKGITAINFINRKDNILISSMKDDSEQKTFNLKPYWLSLGLKKEKHISTKHLNRTFSFSNLMKVNSPIFFIKEQFIQFLDNRILYLSDKKLLSKYQKHKIPIDYIIIAQNTRIDISELDLYFKAKTIIIDSSNSSYNLQFWKTQQALHPSKRVYIVSESGAFIEDILPKKNII